MGKSRTGAETLVQRVLDTPTAPDGSPTEWAIVAETFSDARLVCVEGPAGVRTVLNNRHVDYVYNRSLWQIRLSTGQIIHMLGADDADVGRGLNLSGGWFDEIAKWRYARASWTEGLAPALRIGRPQVIVTTTPKPSILLKDWMGRDDGSVVVTRGSTFDNAANLSAAALSELRKRYEGTRLGRQELYGEYLDDNPGALWTRGNIDEHRRALTDLPTLVRIVVAIDPAGTANDESDHTGIVVAGVDAQEHFWVLEDLTLKASPDGWARAAVDAYHRYKADRIVAEVNFGADMVESTIRHVDHNVAYTKVTASRGKKIRAEPISAIYEQGRAHHVGGLPDLEDEMISWTPDADWSPNRLDACLIAGTTVLARRGDVPIEDVQPGELVWTRAGWRLVEATRCTRREARVMTAVTADGRRITGTPDHLVWTENRGWARLDSLVWADTIVVWNRLSPSTSTACVIPGTRKAGSAPTGSTTRLLVAPALSSTTVRSTSAITVQFPTATTSTTRTTTRSTTTPRTLSRSVRRSTSPNTPTRSWSGTEGQDNRLISPMSGIWLPSGTEATRGERGTGNTAPGLGKTVSTSSTPVSLAARSSSAATPGEPSTARNSASKKITETPTPTRSACRVLSAEQSSGRTSTGSSPRPAAGRVVQLYAEPELRDVYDLQVADVHEFVANGVLVHNCVWAITDLADIGGMQFYMNHVFAKEDAAGSQPQLPPDETPAPLGIDDLFPGQTSQEGWRRPL